MNKRPFVDHQSRRTRLLPSTSFLVSSRGPSLPEGSAFRLVRSPGQGRNNLAHRETSFFLSGGKLETKTRSPTGAPPFVCKGGFMPQTVRVLGESQIFAANVPRTKVMEIRSFRAAKKSIRSFAALKKSSGAFVRQQSRPRDLLLALSSGVPSGTT